MAINSMRLFSQYVFSLGFFLRSLTKKIVRFCSIFHRNERRRTFLFPLHQWDSLLFPKIFPLLFDNSVLLFSRWWHQLFFDLFVVFFIDLTRDNALFLSETYRPHCNELLSSHEIGHTGTSTGITNSIRLTERTHASTNSFPLDLDTSSQLPSRQITNNNKEKYLRYPEQQSTAYSFSESQFYARSSQSPMTQRSSLHHRKVDEMDPPTVMDETYHDALDDFQTNNDRIIDDKGKVCHHVSSFKCIAAKSMPRKKRRRERKQ